jgi:trans-aconitate methyltransferase
MSAYKIIRTIYHKIVPRGLRDFIYLRSPATVSRLRRRIVLSLEEAAPHDDVYDSEYYQQLVEPTMKISAGVMAATIVSRIKPTNVVDIGCGTGLLLSELRVLGVSCRGYDYAQAAIDICRKRGLNVSQLDIESATIPTERVDLVVSTEVAEHLPEHCADRFVEMLTTISNRTILLTAATPGEKGGTDHVNEQPTAYWIEKMRAKGFNLDEPLSSQLQSLWKERGVAHCFWSSLMIFNKTSP